MAKVQTAKAWNSKKAIQQQGLIQEITERGIQAQSGYWTQTGPAARLEPYRPRDTAIKSALLPLKSMQGAGIQPQNREGAQGKAQEWNPNCVIPTSWNSTRNSQWFKAPCSELALIFFPYEFSPWPNCKLPGSGRCCKPLPNAPQYGAKSNTETFEISVCVWV